jgi:nucleoside-diphosphate-sugar epimerase
MKILFTGATGVIGRRAVPLLAERGHDVIAVSRRDEDAAWLEGLGAQPLAVDLFDRSAVMTAASGVDAVFHFATSIPPLASMGDRAAWAMNDRLRSEATDHLVEAALAQGVQRFVQESVSFVYRDGGDEWIDETAPVEPPWEVLDSAIDAEGKVGRFSAAGRVGVILRLGSLYGPGRASSEYVESVRSRRVPVVGRGRNFVSSLHVDDAGSAVEAALAVPSGIYNVVDDRPLTSAELTDAVADELGVTRPRRIPAILARLVAGPAMSLLSVSQRVSNQKFTQAAGWHPRYASALEGWYDMVRKVASR